MEDAITDTVHIIGVVETLCVCTVTEEPAEFYA
jgi:hypothetical protein